MHLHPLCIILLSLVGDIAAECGERVPELLDLTDAKQIRVLAGCGPFKKEELEQLSAKPHVMSVIGEMRANCSKFTIADAAARGDPALDLAWIGACYYPKEKESVLALDGPDASQVLRQTAAALKVIGPDHNFIAPTDSHSFMAPILPHLLAQQIHEGQAFPSWSYDSIRFMVNDRLAHGRLQKVLLDVAQRDPARLQLLLSAAPQILYEVDLLIHLVEAIAETHPKGSELLKKKFDIITGNRIAFAKLELESRGHVLPGVLSRINEYLAPKLAVGSDGPPGPPSGGILVILTNEAEQRANAKKYTAAIEAANKNRASMTLRKVPGGSPIAKVTAGSEGAAVALSSGGAAPPQPQPQPEVAPPPPQPQPEVAPPPPQPQPEVAPPPPQPQPEVTSPPPQPQPQPEVASPPPPPPPSPSGKAAPPPPPPPSGKAAPPPPPPPSGKAAPPPSAALLSKINGSSEFELSKSIENGIKDVQAIRDDLAIALKARRGAIKSGSDSSNEDDNWDDDEKTPEEPIEKKAAKSIEKEATVPDKEKPPTESTVPMKPNRGPPALPQFPTSRPSSIKIATNPSSMESLAEQLQNKARNLKHAGDGAKSRNGEKGDDIGMFGNTNDLIGRAKRLNDPSTDENGVEEEGWNEPF
jgi:hypothetical protein